MAQETEWMMMLCSQYAICKKKHGWFQISIMIKKCSKSAIVKIKYMNWIYRFLKLLLKWDRNGHSDVSDSECVFGGDKLVNWTSPVSQDA